MKNNINFAGSFFVFDVESIGLHGEAFAVAGLLIRRNGSVISEFAYHCYSRDAIGFSVNRKWVEENVKTNNESVMVSKKGLFEVFWQEWLNAKSQHGAMMFVECGWPVEARFLASCVDAYAEEREWEGPYPMHEIATMMMAAGMDVHKTYDRLPNELPAHEPLADARLSARLLITALNKLAGLDNPEIE